MSRLEKLRNFLRLSRAERVVLLEAWALLLLAELGLRIVPFERLLQLFRASSRKRRDAAASGYPTVPRLVWLVEAAARHAPLSETCLKRALVLFWLLGRRGVATTLRIGVTRRGGTLTAHAWLEPEGEELRGLPGSEGHSLLFLAR